jgi:hypothetical protein
VTRAGTPTLMRVGATRQEAGSDGQLVFQVLCGSKRGRMAVLNQTETEIRTAQSLNWEPAEWHDEFRRDGFGFRWNRGPRRSRQLSHSDSFTPTSGVLSFW